MKPSDLQIQEEVDKISSFIKTGLFTLAVILVAGLAVIYSQKKMSQTQTTLADQVIRQKELPIYSVDTQEPKIALSFDAAWAEGRMLEKQRSAIAS